MSTIITSNITDKHLVLLYNLMADLSGQDEIVAQLGDILAVVNSVKIQSQQIADAKNNQKKSCLDWIEFFGSAHFAKNLIELSEVKNLCKNQILDIVAFATATENRREVADTLKKIGFPIVTPSGYCPFDEILSIIRRSPYFQLVNETTIKIYFYRHLLRESEKVFEFNLPVARTVFKNSFGLPSTRINLKTKFNPDTKLFTVTIGDTDIVYYPNENETVEDACYTTLVFDFSPIETP